MIPNVFVWESKAEALHVLAQRNLPQTIRARTSYSRSVVRRGTTSHRLDQHELGAFAFANRLEILDVWRKRACAAIGSLSAAARVESIQYEITS